LRLLEKIPTPGRQDNARTVAERSLRRLVQRFSVWYASADSTPLFVIAVADYFQRQRRRNLFAGNVGQRETGLRIFAATDTDGDGLIENTRVGHGWVEGGTLYPVHEEIYLAGLWAQSCRAISSLAAAIGDQKLQTQANAAAQRAKDQIEKVFWQESSGIYAFAIKQDRSMVDEVTVMPTGTDVWKILDDSPRHRMLETDRIGECQHGLGHTNTQRSKSEIRPASVINTAAWAVVYRMGFAWGLQLRSRASWVCGAEIECGIDLSGCPWICNRSYVRRF